MTQEQIAKMTPEQARVYKQRAALRMFVAACDFADAEIQIKNLRLVARQRNCPSWTPHEPEVGHIGGPCEEPECAECEARRAAWHSIAKIRKQRHLARRRLLNWRGKVAEAKP